MISAHDFLLQHYLPTTSNNERELWLRTNEQAQRFLEIMQDYAKEVCDECNGIMPDCEELASELLDEFPDDIEMSSIQQKIFELTVKNSIESIESAIRDISKQI